MTWLLLMTTLFLPISEVVDVRLAFPSSQHDIFSDYSNSTFSQTIRIHSDSQTIYADIRNSNYQDLNFSIRVLPDTNYITGLTSELRELIHILLEDGLYLGEYFRRISDYLKCNIRYSEENLPRHPAFVVLNKRTDCVGYANLMKVFLDAVSVRSREIRGFYLKADGAPSSLTPVPHRWLEIELPNNTKFFFDPQYQTFSANYLATRPDIDFKRIKRFKVTVVKRSKKLIN